MAGSIQEGDHLSIHIDSICANVLGDTPRLTGGNGGLPDGVQSGGLAMVNVTHNHHHGGPGLKLFGGVHMVVDDLFLDGNGNFLLHLAAHFCGHELGGIKIDGLVDGGHDAVAHQALDDLTGGLLHPGSQLAYGDFLGNLHGDRGLPGYLHLEAAHLLLLLVAGLVALEAILLLLLLLLTLAANALLAALEVLDPLGDQIVHISKPVSIDLDGGGVHHPALPLPLRLLGLLRLGGLGAGGILDALGPGVSSGFLAALVLGTISLVRLLLRLSLLGFRLLRLRLRRFLGRRRPHGKHLLDGSNLMLLSHVVKHQVQLRVRQHLGVGLGLLIELSDDLRDLLRRHAEIGGNLLNAILNKTHLYTHLQNVKCFPRNVKRQKGHRKFGANRPSLLIFHFRVLHPAFRICTQPTLAGTGS